MKKPRAVVALFSILLVSAVLSREALANKSSVEIEAPESASKGSEIIIKVHVSHAGNTRFHYTNWVYVKVNGEEAERWEFSGSDLPESGEFTREVKYRIEKDILIEARANCNMHGSAGSEEKKVEVEQARKEEKK